MSETIRRKLIEVALPLEAINRESAREKSIRHGHPSTLHLWWARRPLAAARAVLFAQLVDDPSARPEEFPTQAAQDADDFGGGPIETRVDPEALGHEGGSTPVQPHGTSRGEELLGRTDDIRRIDRDAGNQAAPELEGQLTVDDKLSPEEVEILEDAAPHCTATSDLIAALTPPQQGRHHGGLAQRQQPADLESRCERKVLASVRDDESELVGRVGQAQARRGGCERDTGQAGDEAVDRQRFEDDAGREGQYLAVVDSQ